METDGMVLVGKFADASEARKAVEEAQKKHPDHKYVKCSGRKNITVSIHTTQEYVAGNWI